MRRPPTGVAARSIQARARSAVNSTRSARGAYATTGHSVSASNRASALNDTARVRMRPSTSGSATFIATSRAESPCVPPAQPASSLPANTTCNTGRPAASNGVGRRRPAPGVDTAKPVAFSTTRARPRSSIRSTRSAEAGSFRLDT